MLARLNTWIQLTLLNWYNWWNICFVEVIIICYIKKWLFSYWLNLWRAWYVCKWNNVIVLLILIFLLYLFLMLNIFVWLVYIFLLKCVLIFLYFRVSYWLFFRNFWLLLLLMIFNKFSIHLVQYSCLFYLFYRGTNRNIYSMIWFIFEIVEFFVAAFIFFAFRNIFLRHLHRNMPVLFNFDWFRLWASRAQGWLWHWFYRILW